MAFFHLSEVNDKHICLLMKISTMNVQLTNWKRKKISSTWLSIQ